jgi:hypothetical protein
MRKPYEEIAPATLAAYEALRGIGAKVRLVEHAQAAKGPYKKLLEVNGARVYVSEASRLSHFPTAERYNVINVRAIREAAGLPRILVVQGEPPLFFVLPAESFPNDTTSALDGAIAEFRDRWDLLRWPAGSEPPRRVCEPLAQHRPRARPKPSEPEPLLEHRRERVEQLAAGGLTAREIALLLGLTRERVAEVLQNGAEMQERVTHGLRPKRP